MTNNESERTMPGRQPLSPNEKLAKIIEWLYVNDRAYKSSREWREALIKMLKEVL